jgi:23S rRNA (adenine2030-N6)-methyltransferase
MLGYRHVFHAGNFADVFKHVVLVHTLAYLVRKDAPLLYLDTHAGAGSSALASSQAEQTGEYRDGVGLLWPEADLAAPLERYLELVRSFNSGGALRTYPGSPRIAQRLLRPQDRLEFCELHNSDYALLEAMFRDDGRVQCHAGDGLTTALARLPPRERRGLVFIDPSYELKGDYGRVVESLRMMHRRFATGVYALWYPLVDRRLTEVLKSSVAESGIRDVLNLELVRDTDPARSGMRGCGMFVVNPPWTLKADMEPALDELARRFSGPRGVTATVEQFLPE